MDKLKLLIVDDSEFMQSMICDIIAGTDYEIIAKAFSGKEALEKYIKHSPDIVTMDINMPDMDGVQAVKELLEIDCDAKIIMCSGIEKKKDMKRALEAGAYGYIQKPFQRKEIVNMINEVMMIKE